MKKLLLIVFFFLTHSCVTESQEELDLWAGPPLWVPFDLFEVAIRINLPFPHKVIKGQKQRVRIIMDIDKWKPIVCEIYPQEVFPSTFIDQQYRLILNQYRNITILPKVTHVFGTKKPISLIFFEDPRKSEEVVTDKIGVIFMRNLYIKCRHSGTMGTQDFTAFMEGLESNLQSKPHQNKLLSKRVYRLKSSGKTRGHESQYYWKHSGLAYTEKIMSSFRVRSKGTIFIDRYEKLQWNPAGQLVEGLYQGFFNGKAQYKLKLSPLVEEGVYQVTGLYKGRAVQRRIRRSRFPILPFWDEYSFRELELLSLYDPNLNPFKFLNARVTRTADGRYKVMGRSFKIMVEMNDIGLPATITELYQKRNFSKLLEISF